MYFILKGNTQLRYMKYIKKHAPTVFYVHACQDMHFLIPSVDTPVKQLFYQLLLGLAEPSYYTLTTSACMEGQVCAMDIK